MQKFIAAFSLLFSPLFALYNGNPAEPDMIEKGFFVSECFPVNVKLGYQGDFVLDRFLKAREGVSCRVDRFQSRSDQGVVTLNIYNTFEMYGSLGAMDCEFSLRPHKDGKRREFQTDYRLTWGAGGKLLIFNWEQATFGIDGKYQRGYPHVKWDSINGVAFSSESRVEYREWQVGGAVSYECDLLIPYVAVKFSNVDTTVDQIAGNMELGTSRFKMKSRHQVGMSLGCSLSTGNYFDINIEIQLIDEQGITLAGNVQF